MSTLPSAGTDTPALATATAASEAIAATAASAAASAFAAPPLGWGSFFALLRKSPDLVIGAALLLLHLTLIILGPFATPYPYTEFHMTDALKPPSWQYWFGTDQFGRDVFSRVVYGAHGTLLLSTAATALGVGLGVSIGMAVGYRGGRVDEFVMRIMDGMLSFPSLLLAMLIMSSLGPSRINVIIAIMIVFIPRSTRVLRSVTLGLKNLEFVEAAKVRGESAFWVITRELLPNALGPIVVELAIRLSFAILLSTSLGFIGIGVQPPEPDWGLMVSEGRQYLQTAPWLMLFPALAISTAVIGANLFGDGIGARLAYRGGRNDL
ncbi:MAG: ABC transporter permease [Thermoanaerobaculia bacterium]